MSTTKRTRRIQIFRAGRHTTRSGTQIEFSEADLASAAAAYNPATHEAPVVVGHPKTDAPAFGWVQRLQVSGGVLEADIGQINPEFEEAVRTGAYKHVSASFYPPTAPENPSPGTYYLRHIGFLGAAPPSVKGLRAVEFAETAALVELEVEFAEASDSGAAQGTSSGTEEKPAEAGRETGGTAAPEKRPDDQQAAARDKRADELEAREKALAEREARLAAAEVAERRNGVTEFAERLVKAGRLLPRERAGVVELLLALPATRIEFAEGGQSRSVEPADFLKEFLEHLPARVEFGERSAEAVSTTTFDRTDPHAVADAAVALQSEEAKHGRKLSVAAAVRRVLGGTR